MVSTTVGLEVVSLDKPDDVNVIIGRPAGGARPGGQ
jgi:hypothetical protein